METAQQKEKIVTKKSKLRVLVIDYDNLTSSRISSYGYNEVTTFHQASEAEVYLRLSGHAQAIVITELDLFDINGSKIDVLEFINRIVKEFNLPIIVATSNSDPDVIAKALAIENVIDVFEKPLCERDIERILRILGKTDEQNLPKSSFSENDQSVNMKRPRCQWNDDLCEMFEKAVEKEGGPQNAVPRKILATMHEMGATNLTRENVASHLQKFRKNIAKNISQGISDRSPSSSNSPRLDSSLSNGPRVDPSSTNGPRVDPSSTNGPRLHPSSSNGPYFGDEIGPCSAVQTVPCLDYQSNFLGQNFPSQNLQYEQNFSMQAAYGYSNQPFPSDLGYPYQNLQMEGLKFENSEEHPDQSMQMQNIFGDGMSNFEDVASIPNVVQDGMQMHNNFEDLAYMPPNVVPPPLQFMQYNYNAKDEDPSLFAFSNFGDQDDATGIDAPPTGLPQQTFYYPTSTGFPGC